MAFLLSPGVNVSEIDLTTVVPSVASTDAALSGVFQWGPLNEAVLIDSEDRLVSRFGKPNNDTAVYFLTASSFLSYGNKLHVARVADEAIALNATSEDTTGGGGPGEGLLIRNDDHYLAAFADGSANDGCWAAKYAGEYGNNLKVSICPSAAAFRKTLTGTLSSTGTAVTGVGTAFDTELEVGSIIVHSTGERKVAAIGSATALTLEAAFPANLVAQSADAKWEYADVAGAAPSTSLFASAIGASNDELHVVVVDQTGIITGTKNQVLERHFFISKAGNAKSEDGTSSYYVDVINRNSQYIRWLDHLPAGSNWGSEAVNALAFVAPIKPDTKSLAGGADGATVSSVDLIRGYDLFSDKENIDISLVLGCSANSTVAIHIIGQICEKRKDCIALLSPEMDDVVNNVGSEVADIIAFRNLLPSTSYAVMDSGWKKMYDKYNDVNRFVPLNGDTAGLCARTDQERDPWFSPAGFNRGNVKNVLSLAFNPRQADRDQLYLAGINSVVRFTGLGTVLYGDKTLLAKPSAFDRINVRRLFIVLEKAIEKAARFSLFEFNDQFTRASFRNLVEPYLRDVQGRRGIQAFRVVCDETNNTADVIDRNEFRGSIYLKPARSINFIQLDFVAVRSGVDFRQIVGQF